MYNAYPPKAGVTGSNPVGRANFPFFFRVLRAALLHRFWLCTRLCEICVSSDSEDRIRPSCAHAFSRFDQSRYVRSGVVRRDPIGLVSEKILPILVAHARGPKSVPERVTKVMDPDCHRRAIELSTTMRSWLFLVWNSSLHGRMKTLVSSSGTFTSQFHRSCNTSCFLQPVFTLNKEMRCRCAGKLTKQAILLLPTQRIGFPNGSQFHFD